MLKLIAAILMLIDHFALIFLSPYSTTYLVLRLLGRLSMPIFAYKLAIGFNYTHDFKRYTRKVCYMTLASQIPFTILYYGSEFMNELIVTKGLCFFAHWNIGLTFLCSLLLLQLFTHKLSLSKLILIAALLMLATLGDYGLYGVGMTFLFYRLIKHDLKIPSLLGLLLLLNISYAFIFWNDLFYSMVFTQLPALFCVFLIKEIPDRPIPLCKNFFYWFYPVHLIILLLIHTFLGYFAF